MKLIDKMKLIDFPKMQCPFVRKVIEGNYIVTDEIEEGYEWVFEDESVMAIEKLHGTNVSIVIKEGVVAEIYNRTSRIQFINKGKKFISEGILNSFERGYIDLLGDGQHFGELIGPKVNGNPYKLEQHLWIPFSTFGQKHLKYKCWGKYSKTFESIREWFKELMPLYTSMKGDREGFVEGIVFTHPDGRMAKLRCDMFDWYFKDKPNARRHKQ